MKAQDTATIRTHYIRPDTGWRLVDFDELKEYRDLFLFMVWRDIKVLYAQTVLGFSWALLQPLVQIVIFSIVFGKVAKVPTEGIPYVLFSSVAIIPWTYMSEAMSQSCQSLVLGQAMLGKIYFPRLIFPMSPVLSRLVDFGISFFLIFGLVIYYRVSPSWSLLLFPVFVLLMMLVAAGVGMWLSAIAIRYRDIKYAMPFVLKMLIYTAPIVYSAESIPEVYRFVYSLNPIVGVIEGFRASILGLPIPWPFVLPGMGTAILLFFTGALYFKKMEKIFVDVI
jgi:lipopolysaccharide transport system permease protein